MNTQFPPPVPEKEQEAYLRHIITAIDAIMEYRLAECDERMKWHAIERLFAIIGEAVSKLDDGIKQQIPEINWRDAKGMRNWIVHSYFGTDQNVLEGTIEQDLPFLKEKVLELMEILEQRKTL